MKKKKNGKYLMRHSLRKRKPWILEMLVWREPYKSTWEKSTPWKIGMEYNGLILKQDFFLSFLVKCTCRSKFWFLYWLIRTCQASFLPVTTRLDICCHCRILDHEQGIGHYQNQIEHILQEKALIQKQLKEYQNK